MNAAAQKEADRAALVDKVNGELRERPVTPQDVREFSRFTVPHALYHSQGRPLTEVEAQLITQVLLQPTTTRSTELDRVIRATANLSQCDCSMPGCAECEAAPFRDTYYTTYEDCPQFPNDPVGGRISQIPFSIFLPKNQRKPHLE